MIIYYPSYYLIPISVMSLDEDEYSFGNEDGFRYNMEENEGCNPYINENKDVFEEIDEEYVNESTK